MSNLDHPFTYQGRLIFNGIFRTEIRGNELNRDAVMQKLPKFQEGSPEHPGSGYEVRRMGDVGGEDHELPPQVHEETDDTILIRYRYEEYDTQEALVGGELETVATRSISEVDLYWVYPDYLFIRGSKSDVKQAKRDINRAIGGGVRIDELEFDFRFLLWIFYKHYEGLELANDLTIRRLSDAETRNKVGGPAEIQRFTDSRDVTRSASVLRDLLEILRGKTLTMVGGDFLLHDNTYSANISTSGRIQIKSQFEIADARDLTRVRLSVLFVKRITELYTEWETRPPRDKYPPEEFFEDVKEYLTSRGVEMQFTLEETLVPYMEQRVEE